MVANAGAVLAWGLVATGSLLPRGGRSFTLPAAPRVPLKPASSRLALAVGPHEILESAATAALLAGTGDALAQFFSAANEATGGQGIVEKAFDSSPPTMQTLDGPLPRKAAELFRIDIPRLTAMGLFGAIYTGAFQRIWFSWLIENLQSPLMRLMVNQLLAIPLIYYPVFVLCIPALRNVGDPEGAADMRAELVAKLPRTVGLNWLFWVPTQLYMFSQVDESLQIIYCAILGVLWNIMLSLTMLSKPAANIVQQTPSAIPIYDELMDYDI